MSARINGNMYSFASVTLRVAGTLVSAFKSINYADSRERGMGYGAGRSYGPIGQTSGKYVPEPVTAEIEKHALQDLRRALADQAGGSSFGSVEFQIVVQYEEPDGAGGTRLITDTIERCTWKKNAAKNTESVDANYDEVEFNCMFIKWNGLTLFEAEAAS